MVVGNVHCIQLANLFLQWLAEENLWQMFITYIDPQKEKQSMKTLNKMVSKIQSWRECRVSFKKVKLIRILDCVIYIYTVKRIQLCYRTLFISSPLFLHWFTCLGVFCFSFKKARGRDVVHSRISLLDPPNQSLFKCYFDTLASSNN